MTRTLQPRTSARDEQGRRAQARRQLLAPGAGNPAERAGRQDAAALQLDAQVGVPRFLSGQTSARGAAEQADMVQDPLASGQAGRAPGVQGAAARSTQVVAADQVGQSTRAGMTPAPAAEAVPPAAQEPATSPGSAPALEAPEAQAVASADTPADAAPVEAADEATAGEAPADASAVADAGGLGAPPTALPQPEAGGAAVDDVALIDVELAEHERWAGAFGDLGTAGSDDRARFLLDQAGAGAAAGASSGFGMGLVMGAAGGALGSLAGRRLATLAVSRGATAVPVPGLGPAIGGVMAVAGMVMRDWGATGETIGRIGTGEGYEGLANDLEGIAEVLDVACSIMDVVGGVLGGIAVGMWVGAVISGGTLAPLALTLSAIATGISLATTAVGVIINVVVRPAVTALRAMHAFESQGDPAAVEASGASLMAAASQITGAVAGAAGGRVGGAAGTRGGVRLDRAGTRLAARRTGGRAPMSAAAGPGPRVHVEVPQAPTRGALALPDAPTTAARPAASDGPAAASPRRARAPDAETGMDPRSRDALEIMADAQRLPSGSTADNASLGNLPGRPGRHLRPGERDPGNFTIPRAARSRAGKQARTAGMRDLAEATASGIDTPRTAAARETLTPDVINALTDPHARRMDPEGARDANRRVEASHVPGVATEPHDSHTGRNVEIIPVAAHREGIHNLDTTRPLETGSPNPGYEGRPGFRRAGDRASPNPRTDRGMLRAAADDASRLERNFPQANPAEVAAGRQWLADRRAELRASGRDNVDTPGAAPAARSPTARSPAAATPSGTPPRFAPHTETTRTPDRSAAMAQYHEQVRTDPGRESGVWQGADGTFYVMQGDAGSVRPPSASGPVRLIYHSHPTAADAPTQGLVSQPSQARGDFGVLAYEHGSGPVGRRVESELHFPVYGPDGAHSGYGATRFAYDPTSPLPLQVQTTLPGGGATTQRYASYADFEARTGIRAGGDTPSASAAARVDADARLSTDMAAASRRVDETAGALMGARPVTGGREGRDEARTSVAEASEGAGARGPAYSVEVAGMAPGESRELPINPAYPAPPGTPAQLDALLDQVDAAQEAQGALRDTEGRMSAHAETEREHEAGLVEAAGVAGDLASGREDHAAAVDSTGAANDSLTGQAEEACSALAQSSREAAALGTLVVSLDGFRGMANLFSYLPGDLGRQAGTASQDAQRLITALNRVSETEQTQAGVQASQVGMEADAATIEAVATEGASTDTEIGAGQGSLEELQAANAASLAETEATRAQAMGERGAAAQSESEAQTAHDGLLAELQGWAQQHQQARRDAVDAALLRFDGLGLDAREVPG
ncbi:MAG: hypothetical protein Q8N06_20430 [Hydrogenophaga sp.]|nr:hypothetical protein [Hydrogenophaga sp.]